MHFWGCVLAGLVLLAVAPAFAADYYVSPGGSDADRGTLRSPFATLARARDAVRRARGRGPVTVHLREGTHYLAETFVLRPEDSGTRDAPVTYRAYRDEKPVLSGGTRLELAWEQYREGIMKAKTPPGLRTDQLFVNGERQHMARYPNFDPGQRIFGGFAADAFSPARAARWADPAGGFIHAMHRAHWGGYHYQITGKKPYGTVEYVGGWQNNRQMGMHGEHRFVENIFEELDAPGEWFLDSKSGTLYFYPPEGVDLRTATVEAVRLRHLVELRGSEERPVRFVSLEGLTFRHAARTFMENREPMVRSDWTTYRGGAVLFEGTEDCALERCFLDQLGGNAVFVNNYNRRVAVRRCHIARAGANGVAFVGDPAAARNPLFEYGQRQALADIDLTPGPKTRSFPAECLVDDCLIYLTGRVEKQTAPVQIELSQDITVRHCSIYDVPRAGVNIGDGCWGGHVIEFCDVFDTVKETGDHGSFNSWGRDRYWGLGGVDLNDDRAWEKQRDLPVLDAVKTVVMRNNRWRCDHGWDIDLDDGSTNYRIYNNLCLKGGIKNREGFFRVVENNIMVGNGFHPHCWYRHSEDVFRRNIMFTDHYLPAGGMPSTPWGGEMDRNLVHRAGMTTPEPARTLAGQSKRDASSIVADAMFVDAAAGDFRVREGSPALALGFENFSMDRFGVRSPDLKAIARTPEIPGAEAPAPAGAVAVERPLYVFQARVRDISGLGDRSAYGLPEAHGVLVMDAPAGTAGAKAGLLKDDVILAADGKPVKTVRDLLALRDAAAGRELELDVTRKQLAVKARVADYAFVAKELRAGTDFGAIPLAPAAEVLPARPSASAHGTMNEPVAVLTDGRLARNYGPVFGNGVTAGMYRLDLGSVRSVARVSTWTFNQNGNRGSQRFGLYGSAFAADPGWDVTDRQRFTPVAEADAVCSDGMSFAATSVRRSGEKPLGLYRWLVWAVSPVTPVAGGENTAFQELQAVAAAE